MQTNTVNYINLTPSPASLIESLRDIGYSIETAIADIIDNSITAKANEINIRFSWNDGLPWVAIVDNGCGMSSEELISAMRFGSMSPLEKRSPDDLGRFGLGMKTASLSQSRHLSVLSKNNGNVSSCEWDLDVIAEDSDNIWKLCVLESEQMFRNEVIKKLYIDYLSDVKSGTMVWWYKLDRIDQTSLNQGETYFNTLIYNSRKHIELVFHRFLSPEPGMKKIIIKMNGDELTAFNPFNPQNFATQELEQQQIAIGKEKIIVQPYILPHHNKVSREEYEKFAGDGGYLHNQGFYVYRNRRLIINGTWFRLIKKDELNKLIRIRVDIPNTLDHLWKIDVKKSHAYPPEIIRAEFKKVIERIESAGRKVYTGRGRRISGKIKIPVWLRSVDKGKIYYEINREHILIQEFNETLNSQNYDLFKLLIVSIESTYPAEMFFNDLANDPEKLEKRMFSDEEFSELADNFISVWTKNGIENAKIPDLLKSTDPFASFEELTAKILRDKGYKNG